MLNKCDNRQSAPSASPSRQSSTSYKIYMTFHPFGDRALLINFSQRIDNQINQQVIHLAQAIEKANIEGVQYTIPAYCSLTIGYDPRIISDVLLKNRISNIEILDVSTSSPRLIRIPVCYEPPYALDMEEVSQQTGLTIAEIIKHHSETTYRVFMLGFLPGFSYLGTLPNALRVTRKANPRLQVPKNSVAIAGLQTGIYPSAAPGGWQIIGRTPVNVFAGKNDDPFMLQAGDEVQFYPIPSADFQSMSIAPYFPLSSSSTKSLCSITKSGLLTTIQDHGRSGYASFGVPVGGAMDQNAMDIANKLVDNEPNTPVLEMTIMGAKIVFSAATQIAITGANLSPKVNGLGVNLYETIDIENGDILDFGRCQNGCRAYLAIRGKWHVEKWLNSASAASTNVKALTPQSIIKKDSKLIINPLNKISKKKYPLEKRVDYNSPFTIRVSPAPEFEEFSRYSIADFFSKRHQITPDSNRMGYRLASSLIDFKPQKELISSGVVPGTIQITNSGQPIILMRDAQTTGGYYRFLNVISEDLNTLAQAKPGDEIQFVWSNEKIEQ